MASKACIGYWWIGGSVCDNCGEPPFRHLGVMRLVPGSPLGAPVFEFVPWERLGDN